MSKCLYLFCNPEWSQSVHCSSESQDLSQVSQISPSFQLPRSPSLINWIEVMMKKMSQSQTFTFGLISINMCVGLFPCCQVPAKVHSKTPKIPFNILQTIIYYYCLNLHFCVCPQFFQMPIQSSPFFEKNLKQLT